MVTAITDPYGRLVDVFKAGLLTDAEFTSAVQWLENWKSLPSLREWCEATLPHSLHAWQVQLCERLEVLKYGGRHRLLIHGPPRYGKSIIVGQRLIPWLLMHNPEWRCPLMTYNVAHSTEFGETIRDLMRGDAYKQWAPPEAWLEREDCSAEKFKTVARSRRADGDYSFRALGFETGFTGKGADCLVWDDPYASPEHARSEATNGKTIRVYDQQVKLRVGADKPLVGMYHRYHEADLGGHLLTEGGWDHLRFPCIYEEADNEDGSDITGRQDGELLSDLWPVSHIQEIKDRDPQTFLSMYQGRPRPPDGNKIKREWLRESPQCPIVGRWVRFWDLATKADQTGDFTAGAMVGIGLDHTLWVRDVVKFRLEWPDACELIAKVTEDDIEWCKRSGGLITDAGPFGGEIPAFEYHVGVEKIAWQRPMLQDLFRKAIIQKVSVWPVQPKGDKWERASGWVARAKYDLFRMVSGAWTDDFVKECLVFDGLGLTHDDQIDAVSGAYELLQSLRGEEPQHESSPTVGSVAYYRQVREQMRQTESEYEGWD